MDGEDDEDDKSHHTIGRVHDNGGRHSHRSLLCRHQQAFNVSIMMRIHLVFLFHVSAVTFVRAQSLEEELTIHEFVYEQKGVTVNFGLNVTGGVQPYSYAWDFGLVGGGSATTTSSSTEVFPEVSYPADTTGSYDVTVTVTDFDGTTVTDATTVDVTQLEVPEKANGGKDHLRLATYNTALSDAVNNGERALTAALATTDFPQAMAVAEVIQRTNPDILCLNEFDHLWISNDEWDQEGTEQMVQNFQINYLEVPQYEGAEGVSYEYMFVAPCNTGVQVRFERLSSTAYNLDSPTTIVCNVLFDFPCTTSLTKTKFISSRFLLYPVLFVTR